MYFLRLQPDFEYVPEKAIADPNQEQQIKELQRKMSALLAENLEISEMVSFAFLVTRVCTNYCDSFIEKDVYRGD